MAVLEFFQTRTPQTRAHCSLAHWEHFVLLPQMQMAVLQMRRSHHHLKFLQQRYQHLQYRTELAQHCCMH
jgi:hypothetical protein